MTGFTTERWCGKTHDCHASVYSLCHCAELFRRMSFVQRWGLLLSRTCIHLKGMVAGIAFAFLTVSPGCLWAQRGVSVRSKQFTTPQLPSHQNFNFPNNHVLPLQSLPGFKEGRCSLPSSLLAAPGLFLHLSAAPRNCFSQFLPWPCTSLWKWWLSLEIKKVAVFTHHAAEWRHYVFLLKVSSMWGLKVFIHGRVLFASTLHLRYAHPGADTGRRQGTQRDTQHQVLK